MMSDHPDDGRGRCVARVPSLLEVVDDASAFLDTRTWPPTTSPLITRPYQAMGLVSLQNMEGVDNLDFSRQRRSDLSVMQATAAVEATNVSMSVKSAGMIVSAGYCRSLNVAAVQQLL